jgi:hypothetical protein
VEEGDEQQHAVEYHGEDDGSPNQGHDCDNADPMRKEQQDVVSTRQDADNDEKPVSLKTEPAESMPKKRKEKTQITLEEYNDAIS